tara:strand:+ start:964 stop:1500 length:537 start_codon:yes stop_codon:yes gene_type:complete
MEILEQFFEECFLYRAFKHGDDRGEFVKVWQNSILKGTDVNFSMKECFWSVSSKASIRGMHIVSPPNQCKKVITCQRGKILDVILDLRKKSSTYGKSYSVILSSENNKAIFIAEGFAHGFQSLEDNSQTLYMTSSEYNYKFDKGVHWSSFGFKWPLAPTFISDKDKVQPFFESYISPF